MSASLIGSALGLLGMLWWAVLALLGWLIPLRDGSTRFTFRYLAWGGLAFANVMWMTPWTWWSPVNVLAFLWAGCLASHWWERAETARRAERWLRGVRP